MNNTESSSWFEAIIQWADYYNIDDLDIYNQGIPRDKEKLYNLKELDVSEYDIKHLPKEIGYLTNLETLDLNYCNLESIPDEISNLINLDSLFLGGGKDTLDLPESIKKLKKLRYVSLYGDFLDKSINLLLDLPITHLEISHNEKLKSFPEEFFNRLKKLDKLILSNVNNLVLSKSQYEVALQLKKSKYRLHLDVEARTYMNIDLGKDFKYFSYLPWKTND